MTVNDILIEGKLTNQQALLKPVLTKNDTTDKYI